jgi:GT2 family glycosyltransferase
VIDLSIVLLTWNGRPLTLGCLASIEREVLARTDAERIAVETIVVDNGSADGTVEAVRERFPWAQVVALPRNRGFAAGNNAGLARAAGRHVCLLNNDTLVQRGGLEACVHFLDAHPDVGAVGPELLHPDGRKQNSIHNYPTLLLELVPRGVLEALAPRRYPSKRYAHGAPVDVEAVLGACMIVRREALDRVGPMPEDYFFFLEETDWLFAMRAAGFRVVHLPEAKLVHVHGAGTKKVVPLATRIEYHRSLYHFFAKRRGPAAARAVVAVRVAKLLLGLVALAPLALVSARERERWRQRAWILAWHVAGRPGDWGLAGVRAAAREVGAEGSA